MELKISQQFDIKIVKDKSIWEEFLNGIEEKTFLQSWNWGEFQRALGEKVWRFGIFENNEMLCAAQVIGVKARRGNFLLAPHGPILNYELRITNYEFKKRILECLLEALKGIAKEEKCSFIRIAPIWERNEDNLKIFKDLGFITAPIHMHPELTWELNLKPSEEELLAQMRKTTRYLIRQGQKNQDLKIIKSQDVEAIKIFNRLYQATVTRHHFKPFSLDYLEKEFLTFAKDGQTLIFLAKYKENYLVSAVVIFWQGIAFYHQGASLQENNKIPAAYLLQWEAIKEAKKRGCKIYNFWGIADIKSKIKNQKSKLQSKNKNFKEIKHPWAGLTLFKTGFGGYEKLYVKTQDFPVSIRYWLIFIFENIRKKKRGF